MQLGGQTVETGGEAERYGIKIIGTSYRALDLAEDRGSFSSLLRDEGVHADRRGGNR